MPHLFISAAHKSSGKTTVSLGLCAALRRRGLKVQPYKKGPDYIDPMWLGLAAGRACRNLDFFTMGGDEILAVFAQHMRGADIGIIEGNKGLYDGLDLDGSNSNAALARQLQAPVILVLDARGMTRGIAPLILGYQAFDSEINIAGVILNRLGGSRHEAKLRAVIEHYTDVRVLGAVYQNKALEIVERHLGLMPSNEAVQATAHIDGIADIIGSQVDMEHLISIAGQAGAPEMPTRPLQQVKGGERLRIGIARDAAFGFYYPDDIEALEHDGAELIAVDTLRDTALPRLDGMFIGGGFPETQMQALQDNRPLRAALRHAIEAGLPVYAECGGLMYLSRSIRWHGKTCEMVGAIPGDVVMHDTPRGRGYIRLRETADCPWPTLPCAPDTEFSAHEFHYSTLENLPADMTYAYEVLRGNGIDGKHDGLVYRNVLAGYAHFRNVGGNHWPLRFLAHVRACKAVPHSQEVANIQ